jgi:hypothetical protein
MRCVPHAHARYGHVINLASLFTGLNDVTTRRKFYSKFLPFFGVILLFILP